MKNLNVITYEKADALTAELERYDRDMELLDGLSAADSLAKVLEAEKEFTQKIVFNGSDYQARLEDEAAQGILF